MMKTIKFVLVGLIAFVVSACDYDPNAPIGANPKPVLPGAAAGGGATTQQKSDLKELLASSSKPVVIKFYAEWCSTCKDYAQAYNAVKAELASSVDFYEIDIDQKKNKGLVKELRVARIPETFLISKNRKNISRELGPLEEKALKQLINSKLLAK